jgi:beta-lactamase class C
MRRTQAYGIRTTADDMVRFVEANMGMFNLNEKLQRAIIATHTGYFRLGEMTQDLIGEQYSYPVDLKDLLAGNSVKISYEANPVIEIDPPSPPRENVVINKTGSTNGFAAYVAFIPEKAEGIVLLANKILPDQCAGDGRPSNTESVKHRQRVERYCQLKLNRSRFAHFFLLYREMGFGVEDAIA